MTDLEVLRAMLTRAGVVFRAELHLSADGSDGPPPHAHATTRLRMAAGDGPFNCGSAALAVLYFDAAGALVAVGAWE